MWYSMLIGVCLAIALMAYFLLSRKIKMPTVNTEILVKKYNNRLVKLEKFLKKNKIEGQVGQFFSQIEKKDISQNAVKENIETIKKIEDNNELIEEIFLAQNKKEVQEKFSKLQEGCVLFEFAGELEPSDDEILFDMIGFSKTKLDFEQQRYFGSQYFYKIQEKIVFVMNSCALVVEPKNIFESKIVNFDVNVQKNKEKSTKNEPIYEIVFKFEAEESKTLLSVPQKENQKILNKYIKKASA